MRRPELLVCLLVLEGCSISFAPPVRGLHTGMPGRLKGGELEVGGALGGYLVPSIGGPHLAFGLNDRLAIEAGTNLNLSASNGTLLWATGWAGVRLTHRQKIGEHVRLIGDVELGAGGGVGGLVQGVKSSQLLAAGLYEGVGLGIQWRALGVYMRARLDGSGGDEAPTTIWPTAMLGVEVRPVSWLSVGVGGGYAAYWNARDRLVNGWFYQAQLALIFDLLGKA